MTLAEQRIRERDELAKAALSGVIAFHAKYSSDGTIKAKNVTRDCYEFADEMRAERRRQRRKRTSRTPGPKGKK